MGNGYNIPADVMEMGKTFGLAPIATGGNIDYMEKRIHCDQAGVDIYVCWLAAAGDAGSPDSLKDKADILIIPVDKDGEEVVDEGLRIRCTSAARAIKLMERIEHVYGSDESEAKKA